LLPALKPALIFECVGIPGLIQQVFEGVPRGARIVVVGVCMETDRSEPMLGIMKELNVQYVLGYTPEEFAWSLRLIAEGEVDAASLVTAASRRRSQIWRTRRRTRRLSSSRGDRS
jgi:threonine dehydrogenase-like Zn-dependent dehydrogenase